MARKKSDPLRQALANETAKIITVEGVRDFHRAKIKASERLGNSHHGSLPSNFEIEQAIVSFQNTFNPERDQKLLAERKVALTIMQWLKEYSPLLVGAVLDGTTGVNTPISIHISCETVESVIELIQSKDIQLKLLQRRFKLNNEYVFLPAICFEFDNHEIEVVVFDLRQQHQHPRSKSQNRSISRINLKALTELLDGE